MKAMSARSLGLDDNGWNFGSFSCSELFSQVLHRSKTIGNPGEIFFEQETGFSRNNSMLKAGRLSTSTRPSRSSMRPRGANQPEFRARDSAPPATSTCRHQLPAISRNEQQHPDHSHNNVGGYGEPPLRQSIVVAKPVRHKNPRASTYNLRAYSPFRSDPKKTGRLNSRHQKFHSVVLRWTPNSSVSRSNVRRKFPRNWACEKIFRSFPISPDYKLREAAKVLLNVTLASGAQAVRGTVPNCIGVHSRLACRAVAGVRGSRYRRQFHELCGKTIRQKPLRLAFIGMSGAGKKSRQRS